MFEYNGYLSLINFILFLLMLYTFPKVYKIRKGINTYSTKNSNYYWFIGILLIIYSVFGFVDADFYHYQYGYYLTKEFGIQDRHLEPVYLWLTDITSNFYIWRLIIWGLSTVLTLYTIKRLKLNIEITSCFIALIYLSYFSVMRGTLGISICFLGYSYIIKPSQRHFLSLLLGVVLIYISIYFHKSMIFSIMVLILSFMRLKKSHIVVSLIAFPFFVILTGKVLSYIMSPGFGEFFMNDDMHIVASMSNYASGTQFNRNMLGRLREYLYLLQFVLALGYVIKKVHFNNVSIPNDIQKLLNFWYIITYIAFLFFFQSTSSFLYQRFLVMSYFPMVLVLSHFYEKQHMNGFMQFLLLLFLFNSVTRYMYVFYTWEM